MLQHITFYDLIVTKARGKSGPLFHFDVHDDIRLTNDVRVEKDESHPGKVHFMRSHHLHIAIVAVLTYVNLFSIRLLSGGGMKEINIYSQLRDGRFMIPIL